MRKLFLFVFLVCLSAVCIAEERPDSCFVSLSSFNAYEISTHEVIVEWRAECEVSLQGYNIYRANTVDIGTAQQITTTLINATNTDSAADYSYSDLSVSNGNTYYYWLSAVDSNGAETYFGPVMVSINWFATDDYCISDRISHLKNAYPNPFNPETKIELSIKDNETGELTILNIKGQVIRRVTGLTAGEHTYTWNGTDESGKDAASGVYYYRLKTQTTDILKKMILIK